MIRFFFRCSLVLGAILHFSPASAATGAAPEQNHAKPAGYTNPALPPSQRVPAEFSAPGLTYKGIVVQPTLSVENRYDSNVLAHNTDEKEDFILSLRPALSVTKKYDDHQFKLGLEGNIERYVSERSENKEEGRAYADLIFRPNQSWSFPLSLSASRAAQARSAPQQSALTKEPIKISRHQASAGLSHHWGNLSLGLMGHYDAVAYEDGQDRAGQRVIRRDGDYQDYALRIKGRYDVYRDTGGRTEHSLFATGEFARRDYRRRQYKGPALGFTGPSPDHTRTGFLAGFETRYKGLLFGKIAAGLTHKRYKDPLYDDTTQFNLQADALYQFTPKLSLKGHVVRDVDQNNDFVQGYVLTGYGGGVEYEILHDWYFDGSINRRNYDFIDVNRDDTDTVYEAGFRHLHSRNLTSKLIATHEQRKSTAPANEFDRTIILLQLIGQL